MTDCNNYSFQGNFLCKKKQSRLIITNYYHRQRSIRNIQDLVNLVLEKKVPPGFVCKSVVEILKIFNISQIFAQFSLSLEYSILRLLKVPNNFSCETTKQMQWTKFMATTADSI